MRNVFGPRRCQPWLSWLALFPQELGVFIEGYVEGWLPDGPSLWIVEPKGQKPRRNREAVTVEVAGAEAMLSGTDGEWCAPGSSTRPSHPPGTVTCAVIPVGVSSQDTAAVPRRGCRGGL